MVELEMDEMEGVVDYGQEERRDHRAGGRGLLGVCNWYLPSIPRGQEFSKTEVGHFKPVGQQRWQGFSITVLTGSVGIEVIIWGLESLVPYYQV